VVSPPLELPKLRAERIQLGHVRERGPTRIATADEREVEPELPVAAVALEPTQEAAASAVDLTVLELRLSQ
jgi:hypothetical protein